ncbi:MAG TPA: trypsin-like peptidase domain-containing protein, partial [Gemmatimonadaceae bacterium]
MKPSPLLHWIALAALACSDAQGVSAQRTDANSHRATQTAVSEGRRNAITKAVDRVAPAVVTVQTQSQEQVQTDPFFDMFFGRSGAESRIVPGLGTGFIIDSDGIIVTNAHVVANAKDISVMQRDGTVSPAKLIGTDETNDIAVIRIKKS